MLPQAHNPFPYPPHFLLIIWPFGFLPFYAAYAVWMGTTLLLYLLATCTGAGGEAAMVFTALLAPATTACLIGGQSGFFVAALLVGGLRLIPRRPILGGILFGLLTYKPQFGVLIPVALIAAGQWRCIAAACATTAALAIVTAGAFGVSIWETWWQALAEYAAWFDRETVANQFMPTVLTNLQMLGLPPGFARAGQSAAALAGGSRCLEGLAPALLARGSSAARRDVPRDATRLHLRPAHAVERGHLVRRPPAAIDGVACLARSRRAHPSTGNPGNYVCT